MEIELSSMGVEKFREEGRRLFERIELRQQGWRRTGHGRGHGG